MVSRLYAADMHLRASWECSRCMQPQRITLLTRVSVFWKKNNRKTFVANVGYDFNILNDHFFADFNIFCCKNVLKFGTKNIFNRNKEKIIVKHL